VPDEKQQEKEESVLAAHESSHLNKRVWHSVLCQRERPSENSP
jgi:predicted DNA-binding protein (MmcQ/YjbR family)